MSCDVQLQSQTQTREQRRAQVKRAIANLDLAIRMKGIKTVVDKRTGAVTFAGWTADGRAGISDACAVRLLKMSGTAMAKLAIQQAETLAGRSINTHAGVHSHDGGKSWESDH